MKEWSSMREGASSVIARGLHMRGLHMRWEPRDERIVNHEMEGHWRARDIEVWWAVEIV